MGMDRAESTIQYNQPWWCGGDIYDARIGAINRPLRMLCYLHHLFRQAQQRGA